MTCNFVRLLRTPRVLFFAMFVGAFAATSQAQVISVNVGARGANIGPLTPTEVAGVVPVDNWNDVSTSNNFEPTVPPPITNLVDSNGNLVPGMTATFGGLFALQIGYNYGPDGINDENLKLMSGFVRGGFGNNLGLSLAVTGIPYQTYDLYLYADTFGQLLTEYNVNGQTYYGLDNSPANFIVSGFDFSEFTTTSLAAAQAEFANPSDTHNYIKISGLTGPILNLTAFQQGTGGGEEGIQGFQIVNAIPEPSSMLLCGVALLVSMGVRGARKH